MPHKPSSQLTNRDDFLYFQSRKCHHVLGDGNCMFRAISHQLYGTEDQHLQIRHALHNFIEENKANYEGYWIDSTISYSSHLQHIKNPGSWGTELELKAVSDYLFLPTFVCSPNVTTKAYRWEKFNPSRSISGACKLSKVPSLPFTLRHIELAHSSTRDHYDSIVPYNSSTVTSLSPPTFRPRVVASMTVE